MTSILSSCRLSFRMVMAPIFLGLLVWGFFWGTASAQEEKPAAPVIELSREGKALLPIVLPTSASPETERLAEELAAGLQRITGASFVLEKSDKPHGIFLGTDEEWPGLLNPAQDDREPVKYQEDYLLRTEEGRFALIGRTPIGLQNAVWDFFHRIGFRQFFPGTTWEVWPGERNLKVSLNTFQTPDFYNRRFAYGHIGSWKETAEGFQHWQARNRMVPSINLRLGHAYGAIIRRNKEYFEQNPEDLAAGPDGKPGTKLDPSRPGLLALIAEDAIRQFEKNPTLYAISMEPSDGGKWRTDSPLGSPSNQAVTIANHAAKAIQERFPGRKVTMLAYNQHSPPPEIAVDPNVLIMVQTYAIKGGYSVEQLLKGWKARGAELGISDFLSLWIWNRDAPGESKASDLNYLSTQIPAYHQWGARYWNSGISPAWGPQGLGYYLASRFLWDTGEAQKLPELLHDFYTRAFESAAPEMREYYERYILAESKPLLSEDLIGRMYRQLQKALGKSDSPAVKKRIIDHIAYVHSMELVLAYRNASGAERQERYEELCRFAYGIREREMISSGNIIRWTHRWDKSVTSNEDWKKGEVVDDAALMPILQAGIDRNRLIDFETVAFSKTLVPSGDTSGEPSGGSSMALIGDNTFYLHAEHENQGLDLEIEGAKLWPNRGPVRLVVYAEENPELDQPVATLEVPADQTLHKVHIPSPYAGVHRVEMADKGSGTHLSWPEGRKGVLPMAPSEKMRFISSFRYHFYFYVPKGTRIVGGFSKTPNGSVRTPDGTVVFEFKEIENPGYFSIEVPDGQDGQWWSFAAATGEKLLMTVPPYLARSPREGLMPQEIQAARGK